MGWINAEERKPQVDRWVLAINVDERENYPEPYIGYIDAEGHWFSKDTGEPLANVIQWYDIDIDYNGEI